MLQKAFALGALLLIPSCNPPTAQQEEDQSLRVEQLERDLAKRDAEITALKELLLEDRLKPTQESAAMNTETEDRAVVSAVQVDPMIARPTSRYPNMCYNDYCPCKPPQGGPDKALCNQLERGLDPSLELMMTGRKLREERRKMASG